MNSIIRNTKIFSLGLVTGSVLGGLAGLIFAPKSGKKFRRDISRKTKEIINDTGRLFEDGSEKAFDVISDAREKTERLINECTAAIHSAAKALYNK